MPFSQTQPRLPGSCTKRGSISKQQIRGTARLRFPDEDVADVMIRIFLLYIAAELADGDPGLLLLAAEFCQVRHSRPEILHIFRFLIIPCHKIIRVSRLIGYVPEKEPRFLADCLIQSVRIILSLLPALRCVDGFGRESTILCQLPKATHRRRICGNHPSGPLTVIAYKKKACCQSADL